MKKNYLLGIVLTLVFFFAASCHKTADKECYRLTVYDYFDMGGDVRNADKFSYKNGLLEVADVFYGQRFVMEYDAHQKLTGAKVYEEETQLYHIDFVYKGDKVVEEIWRDIITKEIYDNVFITYDQEGKILRSESFIFEYYCVNTYYPNGSLKSWHFFSSGLSSSMGEYTYEDNYKNPYTSIKGLYYCFWQGNPAFGIRAGNRWYTSEKITLWDEDNKPFTLYEQDATKTVWHTGEPPFPIQADYTDKLTNSKILNTFEYEACNSNSAPKVSTGNRQLAPVKSIHNRKILPYMQSLQKRNQLKN